MQQKGSTKPDTSYLKGLIQATGTVCDQETGKARETAARVRLIAARPGEASRAARPASPWSPEQKGHTPEEGMACRATQEDAVG